MRDSRRSLGSSCHEKKNSRPISTSHPHTLAYTYQSLRKLKDCTTINVNTYSQAVLTLPESVEFSKMATVSSREKERKTHKKATRLIIMSNLVVSEVKPGERLVVRQRRCYRRQISNPFPLQLQLLQTHFKKRYIAITGGRGGGTLISTTRTYIRILPVRLSPLGSHV